MKVDLKDKFFWIVFLELLFGFGGTMMTLPTTIASKKLGNNIKQPSAPKEIKIRKSNYDDVGRKSDSRTTWTIIDIMVPMGLAPLVFRSNLYAHEKELEKPELLTLLVTGGVVYLTGGICLVTVEAYQCGSFCIIAGCLLIVDAIFSVI